MVHILLLILKIIGIALLVLLFLLLLILCSLLFVPVRYYGEIHKQEDGLEKLAVRGKVSWLFRLFVLEGIYRNGQAKGAVRVLGIPLHRFGRGDRSGKEKQEGERTAAKVEKGENVETPEKEAAKKVIAEKETLKKETAKANYEPEESVSGKELERDAKQESRRQMEAISAEEHPEQITQDSGEIPWEKAVRFLQWIGRKVSGCFRMVFRWLGKLFGLPQRIAGILNRTRESLQRLKRTCREWKRFLSSEPFQEGMKLLMREILGLLREIRPRKVKGELKFGFEDPAVTGQALGALSLFYPALPQELKIMPVFEQKLFRTDMSFAGRIYGITLVRMLWHLYRDRNIRILYRKFRNSSAD